jgi:hypothetical protein
MSEKQNLDGCRKGCFFAIIGFVIVAIIGNLGSNHSTRSSVPSAPATPSALADTMSQHGARVEAESILAATPNVAKLSDSLVNSLTDVIPQQESLPKTKQLWKEYYRRNERRRIAEAKENEAEHVKTILQLASCTPSRTRVSSLVTKHPGWKDEDVASVACRKIRIGMDAEQVIAAWGRPQDINTTTTAYGRSDQFVWEDSDGLPYQYAYFDDGILTSIQN